MTAMGLARSIDNGPSVGVDGEHRATAGLIECLLKFLKGEQGVAYCCGIYTDEVGNRSCKDRYLEPDPLKACFSRTKASEEHLDRVS